MKGTPAALVLCGLLWAPARADPAPSQAAGGSTAVLIDRCVDVNDAIVRRLVALEIGMPVSSQAPADLVINVECAAGSVQLRLQDHTTATVLARSVDLAALPGRARERLLAMSIAELISASVWDGASETQPSSSPASASVTSTVTRPTPTPARELPPQSAPVPPPPPPELGLGAAVALVSRNYFGGPGPSMGLALSGRITWPPGFGLLADVTTEHAVAEVASGEVQIDGASGSLALVGEGTHQGLATSGGIGVRIGVDRMTGISLGGSYSGHSIAAPWAGPMVTGSVAYGLTEHLRVGITAEVGVVTLPIDALVAGQPAVAIAGPWLLFGASAGLDR